MSYERFLGNSPELGDELLLYRSFIVHDDIPSVCSLLFDVDTLGSVKSSLFIRPWVDADHWSFSYRSTPSARGSVFRMHWSDLAHYIDFTDIYSDSDTKATSSVSPGYVSGESGARVTAFYRNVRDGTL